MSKNKSNGCLLAGCLEQFSMVFAVAELFLIFFPHRGSLFEGGSLKLINADLRRLYTATSLMQIDDNIMRCVFVLLGRLYVKHHKLHCSLDILC